MRHPKVFISYSWENEAHKNWVRRLAVELQDNGTEVVLDQWDSYPGMDIPMYMEKSVRESDFVLLICTPPFARKANSGTGGVGYEKIVVTGEIFVGSNSAGKFIPIVRSGAPEEALPSCLKSKLYLDFRDEGQFSRKPRGAATSPPRLTPFCAASYREQARSRSRCRERRRRRRRRR